MNLKNAGNASSKSGRGKDGQKGWATEGFRRVCSSAVQGVWEKMGFVAGNPQAVPLVGSGRLTGIEVAGRP